MRIGITGADGFAGWHLRCFLHGDKDDVAVPCDQAAFEDGSGLEKLARTCDAVVHLAGVNRGSEEAVLHTNIAITERLLEFLERADAKPHVLFASSVQIDRDNTYGAAKRACAERLQKWADRTGAKFTCVVLPNIFGEFGRPYYNSVIATFCHELTQGGRPEIHVDAPLELIHAQDVAAKFLELVHSGTTGTVRVQGHSPLLVSEILARLRSLNVGYEAGTFPSVSDPFQLMLFNTLRSFRFPGKVRGEFKVNRDARGCLWEVARSSGTGQSFVSWTEPGITRGNHYHRHKIERFAVLMGSARIRLRKLFTSTVETFDVSGDAPGYVDMPTFCTHSIENVGSDKLLTLFWSSELFDPQSPDTYGAVVLDQEASV